MSLTVRWDRSTSGLSVPVSGAASVVSMQKRWQAAWKTFDWYSLPLSIMMREGTMSGRPVSLPSSSASISALAHGILRNSLRSNGRFGPGRSSGIVKVFASRYARSTPRRPSVTMEAGMQWVALSINVVRVGRNGWPLSPRTMTSSKVESIWNSSPGA